jgi:hypothetical protein
MGSKVRPLDSGYVPQFHTMGAGEWHDILAQFSDANLYQTCSYEAVRGGADNVSHFVLRHNSRVVAAAQARVVRIPLTRLAVAYVRWGPLWQPQRDHGDLAWFRMAIREMRNEYVCRRGWILRLLPGVYGADPDCYQSALQEEGFLGSREPAQRTLVLDIRPSIAELRANLDQKWRNRLNKAEKQGVELAEGIEEDLFEAFIGIYRQLLERKRFRAPSDIDTFRIIQRELPLDLKMRVFLCITDGVPSAGAVFSAVGDTCVYLFGATSEAGMRNNASYLIQWKAIEWMKNRGCRFYNLNGINPESNPGTYHFKAGVAGKIGLDVRYLGRFSSFPGPVVAMPIVKRLLSLPRRR